MTQRSPRTDLGVLRLWHDDIRPAPNGWVWARTNEEAKAVLRTGEVAEISLDHDLGLDHYSEAEVNANPELLFGKGQSEQTGMHLVVWMIEEARVPGIVTIHSWNPAGASRMRDALKASGYGNVLVIPYTVPGTVLL